MAQKIILKDDMKIKNSAVGFSYTTAYFGSLVPLFRFDMEGFVLIFAVELLMMIIVFAAFLENNYILYGIGIVLSLVVRIFLGFWYNKFYTIKLLEKGLEPIDEYSDALLILYGFKKIDDNIDLIKYKIMIDSSENTKAIIFIISQVINVIGIIVTMIFLYFYGNIFNFFYGPYEQTQEQSQSIENSNQNNETAYENTNENTSENTNENTNESTNSNYNSYLDDEDIYRADKVYDEVINKENYDYLYQFTKDELGIIRNTFYARRGYIFTDQKYKEYFSQKSWYKPTTYIMDILPPQEKKLTRIIKEYESQAY